MYIIVLLFLLSSWMDASDNTLSRGSPVSLLPNTKPQTPTTNYQVKPIRSTNYPVPSTQPSIIKIGETIVRKWEMGELRFETSRHEIIFY